MSKLTDWVSNTKFTDDGLNSLLVALTLKEYLLKLQENLICTQLEFLLLKSLEVQLIWKIKW